MRDLATPLELWEVPECINATEKIDSKSQYFDISRWHICDLTMGQPSRYQNRVSMDIEKKGGGGVFRNIQDINWRTQYVDLKHTVKK